MEDLELMLAGLAFERQILLPFEYKSIDVRRGFRCDLIVEGKVIVEIKTVDKLLKVHDAQVLTYLKLSGIPVGLLMNFNSVPLKERNSAPYICRTLRMSGHYPVKGAGYCETMRQ